MEFRIKTLLGGYLSMRDYNAQVGKMMVTVKALSRIALLGMPHRMQIT